MAEFARAFAGSIPHHYDTRLGPMFMEPYARDLARRVPRDAGRVLEIAAGTGIVSSLVTGRIGPGASVVVTDLQEAMLDVARARLTGDVRVEVRVADAESLPFPDGDFDAVVCQFGLMFFADRPRALREARRVLREGGVFLLNTWMSLADNPVAGITHEVIQRSLPDDPPPFLTLPFSLHEPHAVVSLLREAGFVHVDAEPVDAIAQSRSAHEAARGLLLGSPMAVQLQERGLEDPEPLIQAVASRLALAGGEAPMHLPMRALVFTAR